MISRENQQRTSSLGLLFILASTILLQCPPAQAGLDLAWRTSARAGGDSTLTLDCSNPDSVAVLYGSFQSPDSIPEFLGLAIVLDIVADGDSLPAFWFLEPGGCNRTGVVFSAAKPHDKAGDTPYPWGDQPSELIGMISAYASHFIAPNRARMICAIVRSADSPVRLERGKNYFGFQLRIFSDNAAEAGGQCTGCKNPVTITWSEARLTRGPVAMGVPGPPDLIVNGPGLGSQCVRLNGARFTPCKSLPGLESAADSSGTTEH